MVIELGDRQMACARHGKEPLSYDVLRVNLLAGRTSAGRGEAYHVDTLRPLLGAVSVRAFVKQAADRAECRATGLVKRDLGRVLLEAGATPRGADPGVRSSPKADEADAVEIAEGEREAALALLQRSSPCSIGSWLEDFARCGVVGEETNKLTGLPRRGFAEDCTEPLAVIVRSLPRRRASRR